MNSVLTLCKKLVFYPDNFASKVRVISHRSLQTFMRKKQEKFIPLYGIVIILVQTVAIGIVLLLYYYPHLLPSFSV